MLIDVKPTKLLYCSVPTETTECRYTKGSNKGQLVYAVTECTNSKGKKIKNCKCEAVTTTPAATPECEAFANGFNVTSSLLGIIFASMLVIVAAVKIMRFAGEDG